MEDDKPIWIDQFLYQMDMVVGVIVICITNNEVEFVWTIFKK